MVQRTLTMLMAGGRGERLYPLTRDVAKPAVTFGGSYKIIDFTLSNCFNSGIRQVYLLTQYSNVTMNRHVRLGWESLYRRELDEFVEPLPPQHRSAEDWYHGTADSLYQNIEVFQRHKPDYVLVLSGDHVYKMDYALMIEQHVARGAELTIAAIETEKARARHFGVMQVDHDFRVTSFVEKPSDPPGLPGKPDSSLCSMGVYVFTTTKLVRELIRDAKERDSHRDFGRDIIPSMIERGERVFAFPFRDAVTEKPSYWRDIGTLDSYYLSNLDLVAPELEIDLYDPHWLIRTYVGQRPPARIVDSTLDRALKGEAIDSLISAGCIISGGRVERSILSPGVRVHTGADVKESVLMEDVDIGRGAIVNKAIVCQRARIPADAKVGINLEADKARFLVTEQGVTVVPGDYQW